MPSSEVKLTPCKFEDLCSLEYALFTCPLVSWPEFSEMKCLVVRFEGECGKGTSNTGQGFASFMSAIITAAIEAWEPVALILDLRELKYDWGDEMSAPFDLHKYLFPEQLALRSIFGNYAELKQPDLEQLGIDPLDLPFSVVVSEKNRTGLTSLVELELRVKKDPTTLLFERLEEAVAAVDQQAQAIFKKPHTN